MWVQALCIRWGPDPPREGVRFVTLTGPIVILLTHKCIAHCLPAAAGECAYPA